MVEKTLDVAVVGAGIGGLALAQGLAASGVRVRVYERDPSPRHRRQGYRIHIDEHGEEALAATLPPAVHRRVVQTASHTSDLLAGFDARMHPLFEQVVPPSSPDAVNAVDRYAFRRALMTGLDDALRFGHEVVDHAVTGDGRVGIRFADGGSDVVDVLVGADGVGSRVRARLLPDSDVVDIGVRCLYGKLPLTGAVRDRVPPPFLRGFCLVTDHGGRGAGFAPVLFREPPQEYGDYLMTVVTGTPEVLGHDDAELFAMSPQRLWDVARRVVEDWHPDVREVLAAADATAAFPITLRSCRRVDPWPDGPVTMLGDAVHPMTPAAGAGANTALRDAALLTRALVAASSGETPLVETLAAYRREMASYAEPVVAESLQRAEQLFGARIPTG